MGFVKAEKIPKTALRLLQVFAFDFLSCMFMKLRTGDVKAAICRALKRLRTKPYARVPWRSKTKPWHYDWMNLFLAVSTNSNIIDTFFGKQIHHHMVARDLMRLKLSVAIQREKNPPKHFALCILNLDLLSFCWRQRGEEITDIESIAQTERKRIDKLRPKN